MQSKPISERTSLGPENLSEIERVLEDLAQLAHSHIDPAQFCGQLLESIVRSLHANGGVVWVEDEQRELQAVSQLQLVESGFPPDADCQFQHGKLIEQIRQQGDPRIVPPTTGTEPSPAAENPTDSLLLLAPVKLDGRVQGILEIFHRPDAQPQAQQGALQFIVAAAEIAADYFHSRQTHELHKDRSTLNEAIHFIECIHADLDLQTMAENIVVQGQQFLRCDRVSILQIRRGKAELLAMSGVAGIEPRSNVATLMAKVAVTVAEQGKPFWYPDQFDPQSADLNTNLEHYLEVSPAQTLGVLPLCPSREAQSQPAAIGILVVEQFETPNTAQFRQRSTFAVRHCTSALVNALRYGRLALGPAANVIQDFTSKIFQRKLSPGLLMALLLILIIPALCFIPAEMTVPARGEIQPIVRQYLFAPSNGDVKNLHVKEGQSVIKGEVLLELRNSELDQQFLKLLGEINAAEKHLAAIAAARLATRIAEDSARLGAEEAEQTKLLKSYISQRSLFQRRFDSLKIKSPIDGQVLTWDTERLLQSRPVQHGQLLLTVANIESGWELNLQIADHDIGHVLQASHSQEEPLPVTFALATDLTAKYQGRIKRIALGTEFNSDPLPTVPIVIELPPEDIPEVRPGATVLARVHCGNQSLLYVWLHDFIDVARGWIYF